MESTCGSVAVRVSQSETLPNAQAVIGEGAVSARGSLVSLEASSSITPDTKGTRMTPYKNLNGDSGVVEYESGPDFIKVRFRYSPKIYVYDDSSPGRVHVDELKRLAAAGRGLATYISQNVKTRYSRTE